MPAFPWNRSGCTILRRMLEDAEAGRIDIILTKSIQRFTRNTVDLLRTVRHLKELGIEVWFEKENIHIPKYYVENTHKPIIDKETFDYVQQEMARRKELGALANKSLNTTCFTGKIKCGICGRSYMHNLRTDQGFEELWDCGSHKLKGRNCGAKGSIPQAVLVKKCAEILGMDDFDEQAFLDQVEKIVVPEYNVMVFCMKNGQKFIRHWVSTAKKDCWIEEYKNRQRAWMKNYMANDKGTPFSAFTTRIWCTLCGPSFRRCKTKDDRPVYWRCCKGSQCESVSIREDDLKRVATEVMGLKTFDEDRFRKEVEYIEAGKPNGLVVPFQGREDSRDFLYAVWAASQGTRKGEWRKVAKTVRAIPATISRYTAAPINSRKKRRVAGYARVSTDHNDQVTSYAAQMDYYTNYIKERNDWEFVGIYIDEGISATNTRHRDGFKRMVRDAMEGKIDLIVTKSVSCFARNTVDSLTTVRKLKDKETGQDGETDLPLVPGRVYLPLHCQGADCQRDGNSGEKETLVSGDGREHPDK